MRHLNPQEKDPHRIKKAEKTYVEKLDYTEIKFPVNVKQYNKIQKHNTIRINVFGYEEGQPFPIHISNERFEDQMNTKYGKRHYVLIKDFNKFMYNQLKHKERKHFCMYCLQCFKSENILTKHVDNCLTINGKQAINMPKKGENIPKFNNFYKQQAVPFVIYAASRLSRKRFKVVNLTMINHTQKPIRLMKTVVMDIKSSVAMKINIVNQFKRIRVKMPFTNLWKRCLKRLSTVKVLLRKGSTNH